MFLNKQKNEMNTELEKIGSEWGAVQYGLGMFGPWQWVGGDTRHTKSGTQDGSPASSTGLEPGTTEAEAGFQIQAS